MNKNGLIAVTILILGGLLGYFVYSSEISGDRFKFKYGLDLSGGSHLAYRADTTNVAEGEVSEAMESLRTVIERRINVFGVSEPIVQVERGGIFSDPLDANRLIIELPGVTDLDEAIKMIGQTPLLEFRLQRDNEEIESIVSALDDTSTDEDRRNANELIYERTGLTGAELRRASLTFDQNTNTPQISIQFNDVGTTLLREITEENVGRVMAIFLDGEPISAPVIRDRILNGQAQISGGFTIDEARTLVRDLNFGALPLPIELIETQTVGATLGAETLQKGVKALIFGLILISVFLILWYRLSGVVAVVSLIFYLIVMLSLFKLIPVVLTAAGIAGFILSLGMAVDANVLIFERLKEELRAGSNSFDAIEEGFKRAWTSIKDGNLSSLIAAVVLYWLSGAPIVKGFTLVFGIGILVSMFTAMFVSKTLLLVLSSKSESSWRKRLFDSGINFKK